MADKIVPVKEHVAQRAHVSSFEDYQRLYQESVQDPATFWSREAARIDWSRPAREIDRLIRGCDPQPGAWARSGDQTVRLFDARLGGAAAGAPGEVGALEDGRLTIACADGSISVGKLRVGDARKSPAAEAGLASGTRLA